MDFGDEKWQGGAEHDKLIGVKTNLPAASLDPKDMSTTATQLNKFLNRNTFRIGGDALGRTLVKNGLLDPRLILTDVGWDALARLKDGGDDLCGVPSRARVEGSQLVQQARRQRLARVDQDVIAPRVGKDL